MIGRPIIRLDAVASTQDVLFRLAGRGAAEGTTVVARYQSGGRGRAGRAWMAPPGEALLLSILFRPGVPADRLSPLPILIADAIAGTLARRYGLDPAIKWPNDILVGGRKVCGILLQARGGTVVAGIGLNALSLQGSLPDGATSLRSETGHDIDIDLLLTCVLGAVDDRYRAFRHGDTLDALRRVNDRLHLRGELATLQDGDRVIRGRVLAVRDDGALLLDVDGETRAIVSGELVRGPRSVMP